MNLAIVVGVLGYVCILHGLALIPIILYACTWEHAFILPCADTMFLSLLLGFWAWKRYKHLALRNHWVKDYKNMRNFTIREGIAFLGCGWFLMTFLGALPYFLSGLFTFPDALFESAAALTTTGVSAMPLGHGFPRTLLLWHVWAQWLGGIGTIIVFILLLPRLGAGAGYLFSAEVQGASAERTMPSAMTSAYIIFTIYAGTTVMEALLLRLAGVPTLTSLAVSMATISTGGFTQLNNFLAGNKSLLVEALLIIFMLIGSINCVLYYRCLQGRFSLLKKDTECKWYFSILVGAFLVITFNLWSSQTYSFLDAGRYALFQTVSVMSTAGFADVDYSTWPSFSRLLLFYLAMIGGCSGSTAGGLKISRMVVLLKICKNEIMRTAHPHFATLLTMGGKPVPSTAIGGVGRYFFLYFLVFIVLVVAYSMTGFGILETLSTVVNCLSNLGSQYSLIGKNISYVGLPVWNRLVLYFAMILGRVELFTMVMVLSPGFWMGKRSW